MLAILRAQQVNTLLPVGLPDGTTIAHKTGTVEYYVHDAGLVTAPGGSYVLVAMTEADVAAGADASFAFIPALSALAYEGYAQPRPPTPASEGTTVETLRLEVAAPATGAQEAVAPPPPAAAEPAPAVEVAAPQPIPTVQSSRWPPQLDQTAGAGAAGLAAMTMALASVAVWARRRAAQRAADVVLSPAEVGSSRMSTAAGPDYARSEPLGPSQENPPMRIRRTGTEDSADEAVEPQVEAAPQPVEAESASPSAGTAPSVVESPRLRRLAQYFAAQRELVDDVRSDIEQETAPLIDLLIRQQDTMAQVITNLDDRLQPLELYAESEESNLAQLRERLADEGTEFLSRSFADYIAGQRQRIDETRTRIGDQRIPFRKFGEDGHAAVETALSRFDQDVAMLEEIQTEQRRVMTRLLEAMRSDTFTAVKEYLAERHEALADVARNEITDPEAIAQSLRAKAASVPKGPANAPGAQHLADVLRVTAEADQAFGSGPNRKVTASSPGSTRPAAGRPTDATSSKADQRLLEAVEDAAEAAAETEEPAAKAAKGAGTSVS
jgi:hypothetical protein